MKLRRGIYKLMSDEGVLYIGQSSNIEYRVACHIREGKIPFKWMEFATCRKRDMDAIEKHLIELHDPPHNYTHTSRAHATRGPRMGKSLNAPNAELSHSAQPI